MNRVSRNVVVVTLLALAACAEHVTQPNPSGGAGSTPATGITPGALGLMKVTISGLSNAEPTATVTPVALPGEDVGAGKRSSGSPAYAAAAMSPRLSSANIPVSGLQLERISSGSFTQGTRAGGGYRYVSATFKVRNAGSDGTANGVPLENVTFLAMGGDDAITTVEFTAFTDLARFDGSPAASGIARQIYPTGGVKLNPASGHVTGEVADVLQVYTGGGSDIQPLNDAIGSDHLTVFPYGFVVRSRTSGSDRILAANPAADDFAGLVTFAFKIPLQPTAAADPYTVSILVKPVEDGLKVITQSPEETDGPSRAKILARAAGLGPSLIRSMTGSYFAGFTGVGSNECAIRIAGDESAMIAQYSPGIQSYQWTPPPYDGPNSIPLNSTFSAAFCYWVLPANAATYQVFGAQSGLQFTSGGYPGAASPLLTTPAASFFPGEKVTVRVTSGIHSDEIPFRPAAPRTFQYFAAATGGTGALTAAPGSPLGIGVVQGGVTRLGDLDHDGKLDLVSVPFGGGTMTAFKGVGNGTFTPLPNPAVTYFDQYYSADLVDINNDGDLDIVAFGLNGGRVQVLLGDGAGNFVDQVGPVVSGQFYGAVGDLNGDGKLDVASSRSNNQEIRFLYGDGTGALVEASQRLTGLTGWLSAPTLGDFDNDGRLDLAVVSPGVLRVYLQDAGGHFQKYFETVGTIDGYGFAAGDLDGDGNLDLVIGSSSTVVTRWYGDGTGFFSPSASCDIAGYGPWNLTLGDMNGDGRLDIITANYTSGGGVSVVLQNTDGSCAAAQSVGTYNSAIGIDVGDLDGDGDLDVVSGSHDGPGGFPGVASVFLNN